MFQDIDTNRPRINRREQAGGVGSLQNNPGTKLTPNTLPTTPLKSNAGKNNKSLLPAGIIEVGGNFNRGDVISVYFTKKEKIAIGISAYDINEAKKIIGKKSKEIPNILGYEGRDEIIHKDDLVKINS